MKNWFRKKSLWYRAVKFLITNSVKGSGKVRMDGTGTVLYSLCIFLIFPVEFTGVSYKKDKSS